MSINNRFLKKKVDQLHFSKKQKSFHMNWRYFKTTLFGVFEGSTKVFRSFWKKKLVNFFFKTVVFVVVVFRKWHFRSCWSCFATSGLWFTSWFWSKLMVFMAKWTFQIHKSAEVGQNFRISNKKMHLGKWQ